MNRKLWGHPHGPKQRIKNSLNPKHQLKQKVINAIHKL